MASILFRVYGKKDSENSDILELYKTKLMKYLTKIEYLTINDFTTYDTCDEIQRYKPMLVIIEKRRKDLQRCFDYIDKDLIANKYGGSAVIVVVYTSCDSTENINFEEKNYSLVEDIVQMHFEDNGFEKPQWPYRKDNNITAVRRIRAVLEKKKVLIYDEEKGKSTRCFIDELQKHFPKLKFKDFHKAIDVERNYFHIIAILRQTSIRIEENIKPLQIQLERIYSINPKRVIVTYFFMCKPDEEILQDLQKQAYSERFDFANIVMMDFIGTSLGNGLFNLPPFSLKERNADAVKQLQKAIESDNVVIEWPVDVYVPSNSPRIDEFIEKLRQTISSSIRLRRLENSEPQLKSVTLPTLVFCTENPISCQKHGLKNLEETDLGKVILINIIDGPPEHATDNSSTSSEIMRKLRQQYGQIWEVRRCDKKFLVEVDFFKGFESFVRAYSTYR